MILHGVGKCREATKGTGSRQELAVSNANRLRDYSGSLEKGAGREFTSGLRDLIGSLVKGAGCEQREQTEGLKSNLLSI